MIIKYTPWRHHKEEIGLSVSLPACKTTVGCVGYINTLTPGGYYNTSSMQSTKR